MLQEHSQKKDLTSKGKKNKMYKRRGLRQR